MFGLGNKRRGRRNSGGVFNNSNLRNAALAGAGMLAYRWWRGRNQNDQSTRNASAAAGRSTADSVE